MSAVEHCAQLANLGMLENLFVLKQGSWKDHFAPTNNSAQSGEFGDVLFVNDRQTGKPYALKLFKKTPDKDESERLAIMLRFSQMSSVWPKSLVQYVAAFEFTEPPQQQQRALLMNRIDGTSLINVIEARYQTVPMSQWRCWMQDILVALQFLHENGVMHRDVHAGNIMVRSDSSGAVLIDLDLMCLPSSSAEYCRKMCFRQATPMSTAPDIWCASNYRSATPQQWFKSDVWATAQAFFGYVFGQANALALKLDYTWERDERCKPFDERTANTIISSAVASLQPNERLLFERLLDVHWQTRPSAHEAVKMLGDCAERRAFSSAFQRVSLLAQQQKPVAKARLIGYSD